MYNIIMMSGETYKVNQSEYKAIMQAEKGIFVPRIEVFINKASVSTAYPVKDIDKVQEMKKLETGVLHDGTRVKRHFGEWVDATHQVPDDNGNYRPVKLDTTYYPEITLDRVFTEQEYNGIRELPTEEKKRMLVGDYSAERLMGESKTESISNLLKEKYG